MLLLRVDPVTRLRKNKPARITLALALALLLMFLNTGCWDKIEIEDLALLTAWGVDRQENGEILASAVIVKPFAVATPMGGGAGNPEKPFWLASSSGRTMLEAMCNFATFTPRFLFCAHSRFVIFGEESARKGIGELLDFFKRNREPRLTAHLLIVKGMTAAEFLKSEYELVPLPSDGGQGMLQNATRRLSTTLDININDFLIMLQEEGLEPVAGCWEAVPKKPVPFEGELKREEIVQSPITNGAVAFKGDRLVGWLNQAETRGLQWIRGGVESTPLIVENPSDISNLLGIEIIRASSSIIPFITGGKPRIHIKIELEGNIDDAQGAFDPEKDQDLIKKIEDRMAKAVEKEIKAVLYRCQQELNTDIFGFGAALNRHFPQEWKKLKEHWDIEFPQLEVSWEIKAHVRLSGLVIKSVQNKR